MNANLTDPGTSTIQSSKTQHIVMLLALAGSTTSNASILNAHYSWSESATSSVPRMSPIQSASPSIEVSAKEGILEIKRLSGLTWDELGKVFGVSRRSVHNWARGEAVTASHDAMIQAVLEKIRRIDQGSAMSTASRLRSLNGEAPLYSLLTSLPLSELEKSTREMSSTHRDPVVDSATLMANWRPIAPFRDRWDDQPIEEVVPIGSYPVKRLKVAAKRLG
ncbi:MAG: hypothetical protein IPO40_12150 [Fibrobacteres bacterium]|nr:hypothetical protein [Fibrobacterota bacterium]